MSIRAGSLAALFAAFALSVAPNPAAAGCSANADASAVKRSISRKVRCDDKRLRRGPTATCAPSDPPA